MIQIDVCAEEMGNNVPSAVRLLGDAKAVAGQLAERVASSGWVYPAKTAWWGALHTKVGVSAWLHALYYWPVGHAALTTTNVGIWCILMRIATVSRWPTMRA